MTSCILVSKTLDGYFENYSFYEILSRIFKISTPFSIKQPLMSFSLESPFNNFYNVSHRFHLHGPAIIGIRLLRLPCHSVCVCVRACVHVRVCVCVCVMSLLVMLLVITHECG